MNVLCESCGQSRATQCVRFNDGAWFVVCQLCAPVVASEPVRIYTQPALVTL